MAKKKPKTRQRSRPVDAQRGPVDAHRGPVSREIISREISRPVARAVRRGAGRRLALVIHALYGGGAERLMSQLASRWASAGHDVHLITLARADSDKYLTAPGITRHGLDLMRPSRGMLDGIQANRQRIRILTETLTELRPEFVLSFCDRMNIVTAAATMNLDVPVWIAEHSDPDRQRLGWFWELARSGAYRRLAQRPGTGCVVLNDAIAARMQQRFAKLNIKVIPPAIELPSSLVSPVATQPDSTQPDSHSSQRVVLSLGRHSGEKNLAALLTAWRQVTGDFPDWRLIMAGDGAQHIELRSLAQRLAIAKSVEFPGWVSDPWPWLAQADLFALTSYYEGFPVSLLEAMASGIACMSTDSFGDAQRFFQSGALECITQPEATPIADALRKLMQDAELRKRLAIAGQTIALAYRWSEIGPKWDQLLT